MEDKLLIWRFKRGNRDALRRIYDKYHGHLLKLAIVLTHDPDTAEDIVQDVAFNLFNKADVTEPIENLAAYVYQALRNRTIDLLRKRRAKVVSMDMEANSETNLTLSDLILDSQIGADKEMEKKELHHQLIQAIDSLNEKHRAIVIETEFNSRSFRELSEQWQIPIGTLLARKSRALRKIRKTLEKMAED